MWTTVLRTSAKVIPVVVSESPFCVLRRRSHVVLRYSPWSTVQVSVQSIECGSLFLLLLFTLLQTTYNYYTPKIHTNLTSTVSETPSPPIHFTSKCAGAPTFQSPLRSLFKSMSVLTSQGRNDNIKVATLKHNYARLTPPPIGEIDV